MGETAMVEIRHLFKSYRRAGQEVPVLHDLSFDIAEGEFVALMGAEDGRSKQFIVCIPCANKGWRPPGFAGLYSVRPG